MLQKSDEESPLQKEIDENLKRIFDETANAPLPPKLTDLLEQLRERERKE